MTILSRHAPAIIADKLRKLFEPTLDPGRVARVFHEFDEKRGYRAYHEYCQTRLARSIPDGGPDALESDGFQLVEVMDKCAAARLLTDTAQTGAESYLKRDSRKLKGYAVRDSRRVEVMLAQALCAEVDALALRFFRSEYLVHWFTVSRTAPGSGPPSVSFRWHCDKGPRTHLKLLVYLNDASEHGGGTAFVDLAQTASLAASGYLFGRGRRRTTSLGDLSRMACATLEAHPFSVRAGAGVVFQPARVLHSGIAPDCGSRFVLTLCLLPSPVEWRAALAADTLTDLAHHPLWHAHADELRRCLGEPLDAGGGSRAAAG